MGWVSRWASSKTNDRRACLLSWDLLQGGADTRDEAGLTEGGSTPSCTQEVTIQGRSSPWWNGQIEDEIAIEVEAGRKGAHRGRLARTDITGDQTDTVLPDKIGQGGHRVSF